MAQHTQHSTVARSLPRRLTSFVGRNRELAEVPSLLTDPNCRLLTLVGPGGIGKTRLAIEVAARVVGRYPDGVWYIALQAVHAPDLLASAIADALAVTSTGRADPLEAVTYELQGKQALLVLDNLEHLLDGVDALTAILQQAPDVKLLVTSRERLNLHDEWLYRVEGLAVPSGIDFDDREQQDAARLFIERARQVRHDFASEASAADIARICRLVDGMPLAIELAARWLGTISCAEIAGEIERSLDFLASEQRDVPDRHHSMRAVFDHSWQQLSPNEQDVCKRLSVFRGGFHRPAAEVVASASLPALTALVSKSLLHWDPDHRSYQMHELLRQYTAEELARTPDDNVATHDAHCAYFSHFLRDRFDDAFGNWRREAINEVAQQLDNIRAAWSWADQQDKTAYLRAMAIPLCEYFQLRGQYTDAVNVLTHTLECLQPTGQSPPEENPEMAHLLTRRGSLLIRLGRTEEAEASLLQAQAIYERLGIPPVAGQNTDPAFSLGLVALIRGDYARAEELGQQARQTSEASDNQYNREVAYYLLARAALEQGEIDRANTLAQAACDIASRINDQWFLAYCLITLGDIAVALDRLDNAKQHYAAAHAIREEFNDLEGMALALVALGNVAEAQHDYAEAARLCRRSRELYQRVGDRGGLATALDGLARATLGLGNPEQAREHLLQSLQLALEIQYVPRVLDVCYSAGLLYLEEGATRQALELLTFVWRFPSSSKALRVRIERFFSQVRTDLAPEFLAARTSGDEPDELDAVTNQLLTDLAKVTATSQPLVPTSSIAQLVDPLSDREQEVLELVAVGLKNREIADRLSVSPNTIKTHIQNIYGKLGVTSRVSAINRAQDLHLI